MSNQDLNELRDINKQLEELLNQKRIIQQKLQDENDMMMVENHLFSHPDIQDLIQEIEKVMLIQLQKLQKLNTKILKVINEHFLDTKVQSKKVIKTTLMAQFVSL